MDLIQKMKRGLVGVVTASALIAGAPASAEDWAPKGTLKLQIGFGAGGSTDTMGRVLVEVMKEQTGWNIIAENKPGGGGVALFTGISKRQPTGDVLGMGVTSPLAINKVIRGDKLPFSMDDFAYIGTVANGQLALVAPADAPFDDIAGMVENSKTGDGMPVGIMAKPQEMVMNYISNATEAKFNFVSTAGEAENIKLLLGGQIAAGWVSGGHLPYLESGDMKMITVGNDNRHTYAPDTATVREQGFEVAIDPYFFIAGPKGLPDTVTAVLSAALDKALADPRMQEITLNAAKAPAVNLGPDGTRAQMMRSLESYKALVGAGKS